MRHRMPRAALALTAALALVPLTACGSTDAPSEVVVTVTGTPSPAASGPAEPSGEASATGTPTTRTDPVPSDDLGRNFDFGMVTSTKKVGDTVVLVLDRWTDPRVADDDLAKTGLTVRPYDRAKSPYRNVNTEVVFEVPVREGATFLLNHCVRSGDPLQTRSVDAAGLAEAPAEDGLVLLTIDDQGYATGGETFAGC